MNWFWESKNGNELIKYLNTHKHPKHTDRIRRERYPPYVYAMILKGNVYDGEGGRKADFNEKFRLLKVGFTQCSVKDGDNTRMKQIKEKFKKKPRKGC